MYFDTGESSSLSAPGATKALFCFRAAMPGNQQSKTTTRANKAAQRNATPAAAPTAGKAEEVDWSTAIRTPGGGVEATIRVIPRVRGKNRNPTKERISIRLDRDVLAGFRATGPGWQTRVNAVLKAWLAENTKIHGKHTEGS